MHPLIGTRADFFFSTLKFLTFGLKNRIFRLLVPHSEYKKAGIHPTLSAFLCPHNFRIKALPRSSLTLGIVFT